MTNVKKSFNPYDDVVHLKKALSKYHISMRKDYSMKRLELMEEEVKKR
jgi:hypothetical protein